MLRQLLNSLFATRERVERTGQTEPIAGDESTVDAEAFPGPALDAVNSETDLTLACRQIGWCQSKEQAVAAAHDQCLAVLTEARNRELRLTVGDVVTTAPDYRVALEAKALDFVRNHPEVFPANKKSRAFPGAVLKSKAAPLSVVPGGEAKEVLAAITARLDLPRKLYALAETDAELAALLPLVRIEVKLDLQGTLALHKAGILSAEQIEAAGLKVTSGETKYSLTPAQLA